MHVHHHPYTTMFIPSLVQPLDPVFAAILRERILNPDQPGNPEVFYLYLATLRSDNIILRFTLPATGTECKVEAVKQSGSPAEIDGTLSIVFPPLFSDKPTMRSVFLNNNRTEKTFGASVLYGGFAVITESDRGDPPDDRQIMGHWVIDGPKA